MNVDHFAQYMKIARLEYPLDTMGSWLVRGEDPNPDLNGPHVEPYLGIYDGKLEEVIRIAVELPDFWAWGAGGTFTKLPPSDKKEAQPEEMVTQIVLALLEELLGVTQKYKDQMTPEDQQRVDDIAEGLKDIKPGE